MFYKKNRHIKLKITAFFILFCVILSFVTKRLDVTLKVYAETVCSNHVSEIVNKCILETVEKGSAEYKSICEIHYDSAGKITAISINPESVNKLKGETVSSIHKALKNDNTEDVLVPLGTLMGSRLFSAKGPKIQIKLIPLGAVASELIQKFSSVGINQTLHSLYLEVRISLKVASPFSGANIDVSAKVCIAETVIIGDIPFAYLD